jgi:hypothetical protein
MQAAGFMAKNAYQPFLQAVFFYKRKRLACQQHGQQAHGIALRGLRL